jgi:hypothetical protein
LRAIADIAQYYKRFFGRTIGRRILICAPANCIVRTANGKLRNAAMSYQLLYGAVRDSPHRVIHAVRLVDALLDDAALVELAGEIRDRIFTRTGEQYAAVVLVQGHNKETLRVFGEPYAVTRVRAAMFNAALRWREFALD